MVPQHVWTRRYVRRGASSGVGDAGGAPVAHRTADVAAVADEWGYRVYDPSVCEPVGIGVGGGGAACVGCAELAGGCSSVQVGDGGSGRVSAEE